jgi:hypothetical protein
VGVSMALIDFIQTSFSVESILLASEVFILGFYLTEWSRGASGKKLVSLIYLIISLLVPSLAIISLDLLLIVTSELEFWTRIQFSFISILLLIPNLAVASLMLKKKP